MKTSFPRIALVLVGLAACGPSEPDPDTPAADATVQAFFDRFTADWIRLSPNQAVRTRYLDGPEQVELSRHLTPLTRAQDLARIAMARQGLAEIATFDAAPVSASVRTSLDVMRSQLRVTVDSEAYLDYDFPIEQNGGANVSLPNELAVSHPIATAADAESYVARLSEVDDRFREAIAEAERREEQGILPPRFIVRATIAQMERFIAPSPAENPLSTALAEKSAGLSDLDPGARARLIEEATRLVEQEVYPAWRDGIAMLRRQLPATTDEAGISRLPGGAEAYAFALRRFTTTDLTADEIHEIGLREVARIETQMDSLLRLVGLSDGTIQARIDALGRRLAYPDTDEGRAEIMADLNVILADAQVRSAALFDRIPRARVIAQPYPEFRWANAAASYSSAPPDGSRPAIFQMPLRRDQLTRLGKRSLVYHETVPGHHFQIALAAEDPTLPAFRQQRVLGSISASSEGWALYAERLAIEQGWYEDDPEGLIGALNSQLFRARRLVVDTGLHTRGWTRQQAIDYGIIPSEVERYVMNPGQACSYMVGQLELVELREKARAALGDRFSLGAYHDVVLSLGSVPLDVLESEVDRYIERTRS